jgi:hypothetical protein
MTNAKLTRKTKTGTAPKAAGRRKPAQPSLNHAPRGAFLYVC